MKIKKNGKLIFATLLVLALFSALIVWHDKAPSEPSLNEQGEILQQLGLQNDQLKALLGQIDDTKAFYCLGVKGGKIFPTDLRRACYSDPLLAKVHFANIAKNYPDGLRVIRYRSRNDFLNLFLEREHQSPGTVSQLDFASHVLVKENIFGFSFRSVFAIMVAVFGLLFANKFNHKR
ncbi:MAG: hypothetical protein K9N35_06885 [Candidatus Marinimicrobia bacterium]|nr:hypothetical protein [Candidatus Neomarinimicrobiota bacterium]